MRKASLDDIVIRRSKDPWGFLGNMCGIWDGVPLNLEVGAYKFTCAESMFQAYRFQRNSDEFFEIARASGYKAKILAKVNKHKLRIVPTSWEDFNLMAQVLNEKFNQYPQLKQRLVESKGYIVEDVSQRLGGNSLFWGATQIYGKWIGYNALGKLLMELREDKLFENIYNYEKDYERHLD